MLLITSEMMVQKILIVLSIFTLSTLEASRFSAAVEVTQFGALGDGNTDDSQAFLKAWKAVCEGTEDGSELVIPSGRTFLLQPLKFQGPCKSPTVNFHVKGNIVAPSNPHAWKGDNQDALIKFSSVDGLNVNGHGQIDGQGSSWWKHENEDRPTALKFKNCNNILVSGLTLINSPMAHLRINDCNGVTVSRLHITAPESSPNTDGIGVAGSINVNILDSIVGTGDDCIAINGGSSFINISGINCGPGHGISIGSLGKDGRTDTVEEIYVRDCTLTGTTNGARIKTWQGGSGFARKIAFQGIRLENVAKPIIIDQYYCDRHSRSVCRNQTSAVKITDVLFDGISGTSSTEEGIVLRCSESVPCSNLMLNNITIKSASTGKMTLGECSNAQGTSALAFPNVDCLTYGSVQPRFGFKKPPTVPRVLPPRAASGGEPLRINKALFVVLSCLFCYQLNLFCQ